MSTQKVDGCWARSEPSGFQLRNCIAKERRVCQKKETGSVQRTFLNKVTSLCTAIEEMGNPFEEGSADLLTLDTKDIADPTKAELVKTNNNNNNNRHL